MSSFTDQNGRQWTVSITVADVRRVRARLDVDLMEVLTSDLLQRLTLDPVAFVDVLWVLVEPGVGETTDEQFGQALAGDALQAATDAFLEALALFFPGPKRAVLLETIAKHKQYQAKAIELASSILKSPKMDQRMEAELAKTEEEIDKILSTPGESSPSVPESSESTPPDGPSAISSPPPTPE